MFHQPPARRYINGSIKRLSVESFLLELNNENQAQNKGNVQCCCGDFCSFRANYYNSIHLPEPVKTLCGVFIASRKVYIIKTQIQKTKIRSMSMTLQNVANISAIVSATTVISIVLKFVITKIRNKSDTNRVIFFLKNSSNFTFRSTHAISSSLNMTDKRIHDLCSRSKKIKRNTCFKETWKLLSQ